MIATAANGTMRLSEVLHGLYPLQSRCDRELNGIALDSRRVKRGTLFMACKGQSHDGRDHIDAAIAAGAAAVLVEADEVDWCCEHERNGVPVLPLLNLHEQMAELAARFYGKPGKQMRMVGVTGTNGKTSTSQLLAQGFSALGYRCGVIGTLGHGMAGDELQQEDSGPGTTPDAVVLQQIFTGLRAQQADTLVMEVTSHALDQSRVLVDDFAIAVFTNLTRDHLDYHHTIEAYGDAKRLLFRGQGLQLAVLNADDDYAAATAGVLQGHVRCFTFGMRNAGADIFAERVRFTAAGVEMKVRTPWGEFEFTSALLGSFNASNLLAVLTTLLAAQSLDEHFDAAAIVRVVAQLPPVVGRMQLVAGHDVIAVIDYAHTPDALEKALLAVREHCSGKLWCVFGCGGNRDRGKRPRMAAIAEQGADSLVLTSDNPRNEDPLQILAEMQAGLLNPAAALVQAGRAEAIAAALTQAAAGDVVLIAGKGHESYQEIEGQKLPFSDVDCAQKVLSARFGNSGVRP